MKIVMDDQRHKRDFEEVRENCPWKDSEDLPNKCEATTRNCLQQNCAPYHFKKFFEGRK